MDDCLVCRSICIWMTVWYAGAYAYGWLSGMQEHMHMDDCLVCRSICIWMTAWYAGAYAYGWLPGMQEHMHMDDCLVCRSICIWMTVWYAGAYAPSYQLSKQNNKYQVSHKYSCFSWWWAHSRPKHVQKRNKHTKKNCVQLASFTRSVTYLQSRHIFILKTKDDTENSHLMNLHLPVPQFLQVFGLTFSRIIAW